MTEPAVKIIRDFPNPAAHKYDQALWEQQHGNSLVIINCKASHIYYPEHWTPLSMKCVFTGKEFYKFNNFSYAVVPGRFLLLNEGSHYASFIERDYPAESFTLNFTGENIRLLSGLAYRTAENILDDPFLCPGQNQRFIEKLYELTPCMAAHIYDIKRIISGPADSLALAEKLYDILYDFMLLDKKTSKAIGEIKSKKASTRQELYKRLTIVRDYIDSCYRDDLSLEKMAGIGCLNPYYLLREFKKNFHITPHQLLLRVRLNEAKRLISNEDNSIAAVAYEAGFQTASSFSRLYKKKFGLSPQAHRSMLLSGHRRTAHILVA